MADLSTPEGKLVEQARAADEAVGGVLISHIYRSDGGAEGAKAVVALKTAVQEIAASLSRIAEERDEALDALEAERMYNAQLFDEITATELLADVRKVNLEAAERERDELKAERDEAIEGSNKLLAAQSGIVKAITRERDELKAEVERLREALKPLAVLADEYSDQEDDEFQIWMDFDVLGEAGNLRLKHCRTARAALRTPEESP